MSEREFQELSEQFAAGHISRRAFIGKMVAGGMGVAAAVAFANSSADALGFWGRHRGHAYGSYGHTYGHYGKPPGVIYGAHRPLQQTPRRPLRFSNDRGVGPITPVQQTGKSSSASRRSSGLFGNLFRRR